MRTTLILPTLILALLLTTCQKPVQQNTTYMDTAAFRFEWESITAFLMQRMNLEPGEKILLIGKPGKFDPLVPMLKDWIGNAKGQYLGVISVDSINYPDEWSSDFARAAEGKSPEGLTEYFKTVDLAVMLPGADVSHVAYKAMQDVLRGGYGRTIHFHWSGAYTLEGQPMEVNAHIDSVYQSVILSTDYRNVSTLQQYFEETARRQEIHITTVRGTDIRFKIGDRPVTKQDGDASKGRTYYAKNLIDREIEIPAGAIRVAPIEESVEGKIAFPDSEWSGETVKGLVLTFKEGKVIDMTATSGLDAVKKELDAAGPAGYSFREFALGFNPLLAIPEKEPKWIPYYGYGAGVVRLSLGDNTELGGKVGGGYVRWNFFPDATVTLGNGMLVDKGKMLQ